MGKLVVIGFFGYFTNQIDGQTIKTREVFDTLKRKINNKDILYFDTQSTKKSKFKLLKLLLYVLLSDTIVILPGQNGLKYMFPIIYIISTVFSKKIIYIVVGGWLNDYLKNRKKLCDKLLNIEAILVETKSLKHRLEDNYKFNNVYLFPNYRSTNYIPNFICNEKLQIVFMSRITKAKGCNYIFDFADKCKKTGTSHLLNIAFCGPIEPDYIDYFHKKIKDYDFVSYNGVIEPQNIYQVLNKYDVMVLPTHYDGEGFPGAILDAYKSGIPVIVSRWKDLPEFVDENKTGFVFEAYNKDDFFKKIEFLLNNKEQLLMMKQYAYDKSKEYSEDIAWNIIKIHL